MSEEHFTGSFESLKAYWEDHNRAQRFRKGGTRTPAIEYILGRLETDIHKGVWLDIACGAGFVQSQKSPTVGPILEIGLDFSRTMLDQIQDEEVHKILGSAFQLPIRDNSVSLATNFFSLSDYPDPASAFQEMSRVIRSSGVFAHLDYASTDDYWKIRSQLHGTEDNNHDLITGNIHLRSLDEIRLLIPDRVRITEQRIIEYNVSSNQIHSSFTLPKEISRRFIFTEVYKPRSLQDLN